MPTTTSPAQARLDALMDDGAAPDACETLCLFPEDYPVSAQQPETEPVPSACPGWYVAAVAKGYTSDPTRALQRPITKETP